MKEPMRTISRPGSRVVLLAAAVALAVTTGLSCGSLGSKPRNVVFITIDTLRADRIGFDGYARPSTPNLDRLAAGSRVFPRGYSTSGWTLPSMATILTGRYPMQHGATDFHWGLNANIPTLAEILGGAGYDTRGYVSHTLLNSTYGFDKGFARFDASVLQRGNPHEISTSRELTDLAMKDMANLKEPFFVWIHYFDPHFAYLEHEPWKSFGSTPSDRYDQEIAFTDSQVGRLLDFFRGRGSAKRTVIVFTADHGEEFGEHGGEYHDTCFQEVLAVPTCIGGPGITPGKDERVVDQVDFVPTILGALKMTPPEEYPGRDLLAPPGDARPLFVERDRPPGFRQRAVIDGGWKLMQIDPSDTLAIPPASRGTYNEALDVATGTYLFDLGSDPGETRNLAAAEPARVEALRRKLAEHFAGQVAPTRGVEVSPELRERLKSLGYIK
jgi:arylsulfatase A-like enzyme